MYVGLFLRYVGTMEEDSPACYLSTLYGVGDMDRRLAYEPHITIHAAVIGEVELRLFLSRWVALVVAIVGLQGYHAGVACFNALLRQVYRDGKIATEMLLDELAVDIYPLLTHDGLEMHRHLLAAHILREDERLTIPAGALVVAASTGISRFETDGMRSTHHLPLGVVETCGLCSFGVAKEEAPAVVEVIDDTSTIGQGIEACY